MPDTTSHEREFVPFTPDVWLDFFEHNTGIQAATLLRPLIGKWVRVSRPVSGVSALDSGGILLSMHIADDDSRGIACKFSEDRWGQRLGMFRPEQKVTVIGRIKDVRAICIFLADCELVD